MHFLSNDSVTVSGDETDGVKGVQQCRQSIRVDNHPEARLPYNIHNRSPTTESLAHTATRKRPILNVASQSRLIPYLRHPESPYPFKPLTERIDAINRVIAAADCIETPNCPKICTFRISDFCPTFEDLHISQPDIRVSDYVWNPKSHVVCSGNSNAAGGHSGSSPAQTQQISSGSNNEESSRRRKGKEREKEGDGDGSGGDGDSRTG
jgi:hypothetical protein